MKGSCLCQSVQFEIINKIPNLYQCHCSLCQKATGTAASSSFITSPDNIIWISGQENIQSFTSENGFSTDFCKSCGSPTPNIMSFGDYLWVPAGLLDDITDRQIAAHIYLDSKASWDNESDQCQNLSAGPGNMDEPDAPDEIEKFIQYLHTS